MALLETLTIGLGASIVKALAKIWLKEFPVLADASTGLTDILKKGLEDFETRRATERLLLDVQDRIAKKLYDLIRNEFRDATDNEAEAASLAVGAALDEVSLATSMFQADLDATVLEGVVAKFLKPRVRDLSLSGQQLANILLRESANYVVSVAGKMPNFSVASTREILRRDSKLAEQLAGVVNQLAEMRTEPAVAQQRLLTSFETEYRRALVRRLDHVELFGVRLTGAGAREYSLSLAYVPLSAIDSRGEPGQIDGMLAETQYAIVRGEAGSGKTTLMQWLAVRAATGDFVGALSGWNGLVPFYVRLRDFVDKDFPSPDQMIDAAGRNLASILPPRWVSDVLQTRALLLVDGVDEVPSSRRRKFWDWIRNLKDDYPSAIIVVSSRPAALDATRTIPLSSLMHESGFKSHSLESMSLADVEALISQWHTAVAQDLLKDEDRLRIRTYEQDLRSTVRERPTIRALASSPLLCSMICALNWDRRQRLPDDRMELYRLALEMLLETRDEERDVRADVIGLNRTAKEELLGAIAYWMLRNGYSEAARNDVEGQLARPLARMNQVTTTPVEVLQELLERSGVLRQPQHNVVQFIHRTFLEYIGARNAVVEGDLGFLVQQAKQESWRDTIVFAAGHALGPARDRLIKELLKERYFFRNRTEVKVTAACCIETVGRSLAPDLLAKLHAVAKELFPPRNISIARLLASAAATDPRLLSGHSAQGESVVAACIRTASIVGGGEMLDVVAEYAAVPGQAVDREILRAWSAFPEQEFAEKVIKARGKLFEFEISELDAAEMELLRIMGAIEGVEQYFLHAAMAGFSHQRRVVVLAPLLSMPASSITRLVFERALSRDVRPALPEAELKRLIGLPGLKDLVLGDSSEMTFVALSKAKSLESLSFVLQGKELPSLSHISRIGTLRNIQIRFATNPQRIDVSPLADCQLLEQLHLQNCRPFGIESVLRQNRLRRINVRRSEIPPLSTLPTTYSVRSVAGITAECAGSSLMVTFPELKALDVQDTVTNASDLVSMLRGATLDRLTYNCSTRGVAAFGGIQVRKVVDSSSRYSRNAQGEFDAVFPESAQEVRLVTSIAIDCSKLLSLSLVETLEFMFVRNMRADPVPSAAVYLPKNLDALAQLRCLKRIVFSDFLFADQIDWAKTVTESAPELSARDIRVVNREEDRSAWHPYEFRSAWPHESE